MASRKRSRIAVHSQGRILFLFIVLCAAVLLSACDVQRRKSDSELQLNSQQAAGRKVYDYYCDRCHEPYRTKSKEGPSLQGIFKREYLRESGLPANDERVGEIIKFGRAKMSGYGQVLSEQQVQDLLAYLHTL
jgi:mono/diheme cytochrome c family protein